MPPRAPLRMPLFHSSRALSCLSVAAVGLSLASCAGVFFGLAIGTFIEFGRFASSTAFPTLLMGTLWSIWLRRRSSLERMPIYLRSAPFAALNAGLIGMLWDGSPRGGLMIGLTVGALFWIPSLLVTLLFFGEPVLWSRQQARLGLDGAERGETLVGIVCTLLSSLSLLVLALTHHIPTLTSALELPAESSIAPLALLGLLASLATTWLAHSRARRRHALIVAAESGQRPDYRVEHTPAGRVLLRVHPARADDYRQADTDEYLFALDPEPPAPEATKARQVSRSTPWRTRSDRRS